jgi:hypothetical protein
MSVNREMHTKFWSENMKGKRVLRRPRNRWSDITKMDLKEAHWKAVGWIHLAQDTDHGWVFFLKIVMNFGFCRRQGISWLAE